MAAALGAADGGVIGGVTGGVIGGEAAVRWLARVFHRLACRAVHNGGVLPAQLVNLPNALGSKYCALFGQRASAFLR